MANAALNAGFSLTVSARALIMRLPIEMSLAQEGTSPQRTTRSSRSAWPSAAVRLGLAAARVSPAAPWS